MSHELFDDEDAGIAGNEFPDVPKEDQLGTEELIHAAKLAALKLSITYLSNKWNEEQQKPDKRRVKQALLKGLIYTLKQKRDQLLQTTVGAQVSNSSQQQVLYNTIDLPAVALFDEVASPITPSFEEYLKEQELLLAAQVAQIDTVYAKNPNAWPKKSHIYQRTHYPQLYRGQNGIFSCSIASARNAILALRTYQASSFDVPVVPLDTEDTIIAELGGFTEFSSNGQLLLHKLMPYFKKHGYSAYRSGNLVELMRILENFGVGIVSYGGHSRLVSGYELVRGEVLLRVNDPATTELEVIPLRKMVGEINRSKGFYQMLFVTHAY